MLHLSRVLRLSSEASRRQSSASALAADSCSGIHLSFRPSQGWTCAHKAHGAAPLHGYTARCLLVAMHGLPELGL